MNDKRGHSDSELRGGDSPNTGLPDDMLRRRFAMLRREDEQQAPEFGRLWHGRADARRRQTRWFMAAACVLVALALLWRRSAQRHPDDKTVASITEWKAPTDFLLETPGRELLRTVPEIGQWRVYTAMPGATPSPAGKKIAVKEDSLEIL
jgi:hypothetical protein